MTKDGELLRRYVEEDSEESFTELVQRHINSVHAIAMRRSNGDSHMAADVTQKVFISLARHAGELIRHPAIAGWLYTSTRNAVLDVLLSERRRLRREEEAMVMSEMEPVPGELNDELLLDALDQLNKRDREAVLMRFFQGCAFRQIGATLRLTEDAARMRVDRALAKLRSVLERRGVASTAAMLAATLGDNTGFGAPAGLSMRVTQAALAAGPSTALTLGGIYSLLASAKVPLALTAAALLVFGGLNYNQGSQIRQLQASLSGILVERTALVARIAGQREAVRQAAVLPPATKTVVVTGPQDPVAALRARLDALPDKKIPEIELLGEGAWQSTVNVYPTIADEQQLFTAFKSLRDSARIRFAIFAIDALQRYAVTNAGALPKQMSELAAYFDEPISPEILARYAILRTGAYNEVPSSVALIGETSGVVDDFGDSTLTFGRGLESVKISSGNGLGVRVQRAVNAYASEHQGVMPIKAEDLRSNFSFEEMPRVQGELDRAAARATPGQKASPAVRVRAPGATP